MFFRTLATITLLSAVAAAAPTINSPRTYYPTVPVTFNGAAGASYTLYVAADHVTIPTNNDLSITSISMEGRADFVCTAYGIDGSVTTLVANQQNVPVGPPQTQTSVVCSSPPEN